MSLADQDAWTARKRFIDIGGMQVAHVNVEGTEPALVLVHGFTDSSRSFSLLAPHLAGRRLVIPDLRGHGDTVVASERFGLADFADDIAALVRGLDLERPVLIGHSLGAMVAIETAARHPQLVGGLCLLAGTLKADIADDHPIAVGVRSLSDPISPQDPFYDTWHDCSDSVPSPFLARMAEEASNMPASRWRAILQTVQRADLAGSAEKLGEFSPLIIGGGRDPLFGDEHQQALARAFPHTSVVRLEDVGHNVHWEEPALVAAAITAQFPA
nr:alpha/beta hydrolase [Mesorhizobium sp.]